MPAKSPDISATTSLARECYARSAAFPGWVGVTPISPQQVVWHVIRGSCLAAAARPDHRALIALTNPSGNSRWYEFIASVAAAHDRDFATAQLLTYKAICGDAAYLLAIDKMVSFISLRSRHAVLLDQLLDLCEAGSFVRLFLLLTIELLIAGRFGKLRALRSEFRVRGGRALFLREMLSLPLLLPQPPFSFLGLLFIDQASLQQLITQRHAHDRSLSVVRTVRQPGPCGRRLRQPIMPHLFGADWVECLPFFARDFNGRGEAICAVAALPIRVRVG